MFDLSACNSSKYFLSILALATLSACGGGGNDNAGTPENTGSTAPGDSTSPTPGGGTGTSPGGNTGTHSGSSEVCFNPALWTAGASYSVVMRTPGTDGNLTLNNQVSMVPFNDGTALRVSNSTGDGYYDPAISAASIRLLQVASGVAGVATNLAYSPYRELRFNLNPGQSFSQRYTVTTHGVRSTVAEEIKFIGIAPVTVPAGTFQACQFEETTSQGASLVTWYGVNNGLQLKAGVAEMVSATINGANVTP